MSVIYLIGGPADGREVRWHYGSSPRLQMPIFGPEGLTYGNYLQDPENPSRFMFCGMVKP
jgi:hypothetical protein